MTTAAAPRILAFVEDGELCVFPSMAAACTKFEGIDVDSGTVVFFDEAGTPLEAKFNRPNATGKILGPIGWGRSGEYHLVPKQTDKGDSLALALHEARYIEPGAEFTSIASTSRTGFAQRAYKSTGRRVPKVRPNPSTGTSR
jgi:hypothetical protein